MAGRPAPAVYYANNPTSPLPKGMAVPRVGKVSQLPSGRTYPAQDQQDMEVPVKLNINGVTVTNGPSKEKLPNC